MHLHTDQNNAFYFIYFYPKFVFLPECCDFVGTNRDEVLALAETLNGDTITYYKDLARTNNVWLSLGGIHEIIHDRNGKSTNKLYNAHVIINSSGELTAVYRKLHLFDVQTPEFNFRESQSVTGGNSIVAPLLDTPLPGGLGLLIVSALHHHHRTITEPSPINLIFNHFFFLTIFIFVWCDSLVL